MADRNSELVIFGVSNMLSDIMDAARLLGFSIKQIVMNQPEVLRERTKSVHQRIRRMNPAPAVIDLVDFSPADGESYLIGTSAFAKVDLVEQLENDFGLRMMSLVHPTAFVSPSATVGEGVFVGANCSIGAAATLEPHVFVNRGVNVGHDTVIRAYSRLNPGCNVGGHVDVGQACMVGMGASVIEELVVGAGSVIAAGAVVTNDVPERVLMTGIPATIKKRY